MKTYKYMPPEDDWGFADKKIWKPRPKPVKFDSLKFSNGNSLIMHPAPVLRVPLEDYYDNAVKYNFNTVVNLLEPQEKGNMVMKLAKEGFKVLEFPIQDYSVPKSMMKLHQLLKKVIEMLQRENVAMHCFGGNGRTGTVAACLLVETGKLDGPEAIKAVRKKRPAAIETAEQERFVSEYRKFLINLGVLSV